VTFTQYATGCALSTAGEVYCFGGTNPEPVATPERFTMIANSPETGNRCALRADGALFCWGSNFSGNAGQPLSISTVETPQRVGTIVLRSLSPASGCGLAADSTAYCWGRFVGDPNGPCAPAGCSPEPIQIGTDRWVAASGGYQHCLLNAAGRLYCFGVHGSPYHIATPKLVADEPVRIVGEDLFGVYVVNAAGELMRVLPFDTAPWRFFKVDTGGRKMQQMSLDCGVAIDGKAWCGTWLIPGQ
jgi:hypothetical protein